jgi:hypothetical protein
VGRPWRLCGKQSAALPTICLGSPYSFRYSVDDWWLQSAWCKSVTDHYTLLGRAVSELEENTDEVREALYERARAALLRLLRDGNLPYSEPEIVREQRDEGAIRKRVEAVSGAGLSSTESLVPEEIA